MSTTPSFDFSSPPSHIALTYPSPAHLHIGGHLSVSSQDIRNYTEQGWRELYETDVSHPEAPPAYQREDSSLPSYYHVVRRDAAPQERTPVTKRLLKFGFWAILMFVAIIARQSTRRTLANVPNFFEKTRTRSEISYNRMLADEIEWGLRCTWAICILSCIVSGIVVAIMV
ncbi:hypothetical protein ONZ45_g11506 [Pleurotus djamor]|nr:hypothetical protein ONZ45_g11506 [Pleurotus djamor]